MNRFALIAVLLAGTVSAQEPEKPRPERPKTKAGEPIELVFLRDSGPLLLRLHFVQNGQPVQTRWEEYLERWFEYLDGKKTGELDEAALAGAPNAQSMRSISQQGVFFPNRGLSLTLRDFNKDTGQKVTKSEFLDYYKKEGIRAVQPIGAPQATSGQANDALFKALDTDGDGKLSRAELEAARAILAKLDIRDDELISLADLAPSGNPVGGRQVGSLGPTAPLGQLQGNGYYHVTGDEGDRIKLAFLLMAHYDKNKDKRLSRKECGLREADFAKLDRNRDGFLDLAELAGYCKYAPAVDCTVQVKGGGSTPTVTVETNGLLAANAVRTGAGQATLALGDADITVQEQAGNNINARFDQSAFIVQQLKQADVKNKGYVTLKDLEGAQFQFLRTLFPILDRNEDGKVTEAEAQAYFRLQAQARDVMVQFAVQEEGRNLFQLLDANRDGQLAPRELLSAWARLASYDKNGDGVIDARELPLQFRVAVNPGNQAFAFQAAQLGQMTRGPAFGRANYPPHAPLWFRKMDRNGDGDVSRREFLGTKEEFDRLDANGDGLIDADEAARATGRK